MAEERIDHTKTLSDAVDMGADELANLNPKVAEAIRAIQAERSGEQPLDWQSFSAHRQT